MNFATILSTTHANIVRGNDVNTAAKAAFAQIAASKSTIASLLASDRESAQTGEALIAANRAIAAGLRSALASLKVDIKSGKAVRDALRPNVWADEGETMPEAGAAKPAEGTTARATYDRIAQRLSRLARAIVDAPKGAPQKATVRIPSVLRASIKASTVDAGVEYRVALAALKAAYGK